MAFPSPERIRRAVGVVGAEIDRQLSTDAPQPWTESRLWTELACCMLSSQVPYETAQAAAVRLEASGLFLKEGAAPRELEVALAELLRCPFDIGGASRRYRFPDSRARQLTATIMEVRREARGLSDLLGSFGDIEIARGWFVTNAKGLGPKQASMFLRNVGASYDLAVLDRHLINYMMMMGLTADPKPTRSMADYRRDEIVLRDHAASFGLPVGFLDWAVWIVMRVANAKVLKEQVE
jgi:N-glycosylase/DNA lyase